jgi:broad specificity phosphatase PhoE
MELFFVRHGESEHLISEPVRYQLKDPGLTEKGVRHAEELRQQFPLTTEDAIVAGPTLRTLQTARIWSQGTDCARFVHPLAGPRQHPFRYDFQTLPCDYSLDHGRQSAEYSEFLPAADLPAYLWLQGIHTLPGLLFAQQADRFLAWCGQLGKTRVWVVTHARTTMAYQELLLLQTHSEEEGAPAVVTDRYAWRYPRIS